VADHGRWRERVALRRGVVLGPHSLVVHPAGYEA
jgi:hypothetical protein